MLTNHRLCVYTTRVYAARCAHTQEGSESPSIIVNAVSFVFVLWPDPGGGGENRKSCKPNLTTHYSATSSDFPSFLLSCPSYPFPSPSLSLSFFVNSLTVIRKNIQTSAIPAARCVMFLRAQYAHIRRRTWPILLWTALRSIAWTGFALSVK